MKKAYQDQLSILELKRYLVHLCHDEELKEELSFIVSLKRLEQWVKQPHINEYFYKMAEKRLYQSYSYGILEYHLMNMNRLFHCQRYLLLKKELLKKMMRKPIGLKEYCIIRYLIPFHKEKLYILVDKLHQNYHVSELECAKICLIEDQYHLAYLYLKELDRCDDENVLELLCSYSLIDYLSLEYHYKKKNLQHLLRRNYGKENVLRLQNYTRSKRKGYLGAQYTKEIRRI